MNHGSISKPNPPHTSPSEQCDECHRLRALKRTAREELAGLLGQVIDEADGPLVPMHVTTLARIRSALVS